MIFEVDSDNIRIDKYLIDKLNISRSKVQKLIDNNKVLVNDKIVKASYVVKYDDVINVDNNLFEETKVEAKKSSVIALLCLIIIYIYLFIAKKVER